MLTNTPTKPRFGVYSQSVQVNIDETPEAAGDIGFVCKSCSIALVAVLQGKQMGFRDHPTIDRFLQLLGWDVAGGRCPHCTPHEDV